MNQTLREQLEKTFGKPTKEPFFNGYEHKFFSHPQKPQKRRRERLSESDIKSLMGINRPTYVRGKGGAYRQR